MNYSRKSDTRRNSQIRLQWQKKAFCSCIFTCLKFKEAILEIAFLNDLATRVVCGENSRCSLILQVTKIWGAAKQTVVVLIKTSHQSLSHPDLILCCTQHESAGGRGHRKELVTLLRSWVHNVACGSPSNSSPRLLLIVPLLPDPLSKKA